jgi:serine/threonine-protein kinase HipA
MSTPAMPDTLYLWYLGAPEAPVLVGELNLVMNRRAVSLRYADTWLKNGFALSEDLPWATRSFFRKTRTWRPGRWTMRDRTGGGARYPAARPPATALAPGVSVLRGRRPLRGVGVSSSAQTYLPRQSALYPS